jgi:hypothetical protein
MIVLWLLFTNKDWIGDKLLKIAYQRILPFLKLLMIVIALFWVDER